MHWNRAACWTHKHRAPTKSFTIFIAYISAVASFCWNHIFPFHLNSSPSKLNMNWYSLYALTMNASTRAKPVKVLFLCTFFFPTQLLFSNKFHRGCAAYRIAIAHSAWKCTCSMADYYYYYCVWKQRFLIVSPLLQKRIDIMYIERKVPARAKRQTGMPTMFVDWVYVVLVQLSISYCRHFVPFTLRNHHCQRCRLLKLNTLSQHTCT